MQMRTIVLGLMLLSLTGCCGGAALPALAAQLPAPSSGVTTADTAATSSATPAPQASAADAAQR